MGLTCHPARAAGGISLIEECLLHNCLCTVFKELVLRVLLIRGHTSLRSQFSRKQPKSARPEVPREGLDDGRANTTNSLVVEIFVPRPTWTLRYTTLRREGAHVKSYSGRLYAIIKLCCCEAYITRRGDSSMYSAPYDKIVLHLFWLAAEVIISAVYCICCWDTVVNYSGQNNKSVYRKSD